MCSPDMSDRRPTSGLTLRCRSLNVRGEGMLTEILRGRAPLWKPFWLLLVLGSICLTVVFSVLESRTFLHLYLRAEACAPNPMKIAVFKAVVGNLFTAVAWFGVWRCAFNTRYRLLGYAARGLVLCSAAYFALRWFVFIRALSTPVGQDLLKTLANWSCPP